MKKQNNRQEYNTSYQLKLPVEISTIIEISDPVYTFCEVMDCIDLRKYLAVKESKTGRKRYNSEILLKVILFAFMEKGYVSLREIEKLCKTDIRFMWLLQDNDPPSHMTIDNFMNETLLGNIEDIFAEINGYIFSKEKVDTEHIYCKHDGYLDSGFEIVTHPMTLDYHKDNLPWADMVDKLKRMGYLSHLPHYKPT